MSDAHSFHLASFDIFPKVDKDLKVASAWGGLVTLNVGALLALLFLTQLGEYFTIFTKHEFLVDTQVSANMIVNLDMSVAMDYLQLDVVDASGSSMHMNEMFAMSETAFDPVHVSNFSREPQHNVRKIVHDAMHSRRNFESLKMLSEESGAKGPSHQIPGCRIHGQMSVKKVSGNLHVTASGHGYYGEHTPHELMNFTHRIDRLQFGVDYPGLKNNPLDGVGKVTASTFSAFTYFVTIIPTIYVDRQENTIITSQYAVTEFQKDWPVESVRDARPPGIFFRYDIDPISVRISEQTMAFSTFLVRTCGLIGGVWVVMMMLYRGTAFILGRGWTKYRRVPTEPIKYKA